jgi:hypothetical protein
MSMTVRIVLAAGVFVLDLAVVFSFDRLVHGLHPSLQSTMVQRVPE